MFRIPKAQKLRLLFAVVAFCIAAQFRVSPVSAGQQIAVSRMSPLEPDKALSAFQIAAGVQIELVASEPDVIDPVAIRFDEEGRMWVVEMRDYPQGPQPGTLPASRIRVLEDCDGDGRYETAHLFADNLIFPTGLQPWRGGVIVTLAGKIVYMKDTNGDYLADLNEVWFTGFAEENTQLRANHPTLGLDGFVYVANGLRGGQVKSLLHPEVAPLELRSHDFRFDPITGQFEAIAGISQYGMTLDELGNRFLCNNRHPLMHVVIEDCYASRNPSFALLGVVEDVARPAEDSRVFPIARSWTTSLQHAGQFTAACGTTIFRGDQLPSTMIGNAFVCEPTGSLVHREVLEIAGATFRSHPARNGVEFLASRDEWFRPVDLTVGPDGALYVVDMYRAVIEHPEFMPEELRKREDIRYGDDRGRIWRVLAEGACTPTERPHMGSATSLQLVKLLAHRNAWWRETAARLLMERGDRSVEKALKSLACGAETPATRMAALRLMSNLGLLSPEDVLKALRDPLPSIRKQSIILAEKFLSDSENMRRSVLTLAYDASPQVRFQAALSLAPMKGRDEINALKYIALAGAEDKWTRRAVAISSNKVAFDLLIALLNDDSWQRDGFTTGERLLLTEIANLVGDLDAKEQVLEVLQTLVSLPANELNQRIQISILGALLQAIEGRDKALGSLFDAEKNELLRGQILNIFKLAQQIAVQRDANIPRRLEAIKLLGYDTQSLDLLTRLASEELTEAIRIGAINSLAEQDNVKPWETLIEKLPFNTPATRRAILDAIVRDTHRAALLLDLVAKDEIKAVDIDRLSVERLLENKDATIRQQAKQLLSGTISKDRSEALSDYKSVLTLSSDPQHGRAVFSKHCATCHQISGIGVPVGPDISDTYSKTREQLLTDILQPNRAIDANFAKYMVVTDSGQVLTGLLAAETSTSVTLLQEEGKTISLSVREIEEIRSTGVSLMPEGLERNIPHQDMADLLSFLKYWRYLDGRTPYDEITKAKKP